LNQYATKSAQPGLAVSRIESVPIPKPDLDEQRRIARVLDSLDLLMNGLYSGLQIELAARRKQYEFYRNKLLTFKEAV
jgi:type I restriction enzyme, S subunit